MKETKVYKVLFWIMLPLWLVTAGGILFGLIHYATVKLDISRTAEEVEIVEDWRKSFDTMTPAELADFHKGLHVSHQPWGPPKNDRLNEVLKAYKNSVEREVESRR